MRLATVLFSSCVLAGCSVAVHTGRPASPLIAPGFVGSWKGSGQQSDHPGEWSIALTLADGGRGAVVGTITYPSLTCGGDLILREADGGRVALLERITFGECVDGGMITLTPAGGGLGYAWRGSDLTARGTLSRAVPPPAR
ncbi:MAG TPA: hypothetical protein VF541_13375 [Longimicrobium sp.]